MLPFSRFRVLVAEGASAFHTAGPTLFFLFPPSPPFRVLSSWFVRDAGRIHHEEKPREDRLPGQTSSFLSLVVVLFLLVFFGPPSERERREKFRPLF